MDRKTARRYVEAAEVAGLLRGGGEGQLSDELIGAVVAAVRPARQSGHGQSWDRLVAQEIQIRDWIKDDLQLTNIHGKLARLGVHVPYRTLHRFAAERCGFGRRQRTVRVADGDPGVGVSSTSPGWGWSGPRDRATPSGARVDLHRGLLAAHVRVADIPAESGCGDRRMRGGVGVLRRDLQGAGARQPISGDRRRRPGESALHRGLAGLCAGARVSTDPARVRSPKDKARVERVVQYVRGNFFAGEAFTDLADAQHRAEHWCTATAGVRLHGRRISVRPSSSQPRSSCCCRHRRFAMTCRSSRRRRWPGIYTSRSPAACIRCRPSWSGSAWTCAPTRGW